MSALRTGLTLALAALFSAACASAPESTNQNRNTAALPAATPTVTTANANQSAAPASNTDGASIYMAQMCAGCHGTNGKGVIKDSRDFTDPAWQKSKSDDQIIASIRNGSPPKMPAYKDKLNDAQIKALVAHIRSFSK